MVNSSLQAATGIGVVQLQNPLLTTATRDSPYTRQFQYHPMSSRLSPKKGRLLTPESATVEKEPAQIRPARSATHEQRSSSIATSEKLLVRVELDGEGQRIEKWARFEKRTGSLGRGDDLLYAEDRVDMETEIPSGHRNCDL